jgi:putative intracellular protease/amidase
MRAYVEAHRELLESPARLEDVDPADFDGVLIPGGHGPM